MRDSIWGIALSLSVCECIYERCFSTPTSHILSLLLGHSMPVALPYLSLSFLPALTFPLLPGGKPHENLSSKESLQSMESSHHRSRKSGGEMPTKGISSAGRSLVLPASLLPWRCLLFPPHHERCTSLAFPIYSTSSEIPLTAKSKPLIPNSRTSGRKNLFNFPSLSSSDNCERRRIEDEDFSRKRKKGEEKPPLIDSTHGNLLSERN